MVHVDIELQHIIRWHHCAQIQLFASCSGTVHWQTSCSSSITTLPASSSETIFFTVFISASTNISSSTSTISSRTTNSRSTPVFTCVFGSVPNFWYWEWDGTREWERGGGGGSNTSDHLALDYSDPAFFRPLLLYFTNALRLQKQPFWVLNFIFSCFGYFDKFSVPTIPPWPSVVIYLLIRRTQ